MRTETYRSKQNSENVKDLRHTMTHSLIESKGLPPVRQRVSPKLIF